MYQRLAGYAAYRERHQWFAASIAPITGGGGRVARSCICTMSLTHARTHTQFHVTVVQYSAQPGLQNNITTAMGEGAWGAPALAREGLQRALEAHAADQMRGGRRDVRAPSSQASACFLCCRDEQRSIGNLSREDTL